MNIRTLFFAFLALIGSGCASAPPSRVTVQSARDVQVLFRKGDSRVGTYVSSDYGFATSSYWIEGPSGLILIDTQFLLSAGKEAVAAAESYTGKKVVLAIVLHPNPDKFNGTLELQKRGIRVVTSEQVKALIPAVHKDRTESFYERYKPDYPSELPLPESFGKATTEISAGGISIKLHVLKGPGCSGAHVVAQFGKNVFPGDLVTNRFHSWLELGEVDEWLNRISEIQAMEPEFVHPGRGASGGPELLVRQRAYLERVRVLVRKLKPKGEPKEEALEFVKETLEREYPDYDLSYFVEVGLPEVWKHYSKK